MSFRCILALLALAGATLAGPEVTELKVEVVSVPEGCTAKSKHGDMLTMHYTGKLENGHKFDSRLVYFEICKRCCRLNHQITVSGRRVTGSSFCLVISARQLTHILF